MKSTRHLTAIHAHCGFTGVSSGSDRLSMQASKVRDVSAPYQFKVSPWCIQGNHYVLDSYLPASHLVSTSTNDPKRTLSQPAQCNLSEGAIEDDSCVEDVMVDLWDPEDDETRDVIHALFQLR